MTAPCEPDSAPRGAFYQSILAPHPATPCDAVRSIAVRIARTAGGRLELIYAVEGDLRSVRLPPPAEPHRVDGLWRHTCFEAFVMPDPGPAYVELNFSPSGEWACYAFDDYRQGMTPVAAAATSITILPGGTGTGPEAPWKLRAAVQVGAAVAAAEGAIGAAEPSAGAERVRAAERLARIARGTPARVALAAVIEEADGRLSYWALCHPPGRPDFHHLDGFALRI